MPDSATEKRIPLFAMTLVVCGLFAATIVAAYPATNIASLPGIYPQPYGPFGDYLREALIEPLGIGTYIFLLGWLVVSISLALVRRWRMLLLRVSGWSLLTASTSLLADQTGTREWPTPLAGAGGTLGAALRFWLEARFEATGILLLTIAMISLGCLLAADHVVMAILRGIRSVGRGLEQLVAFLLKPRKREQAVSLPQEHEVDTPLETLPISLTPTLAELPHTVDTVPITQAKAATPPTSTPPAKNRLSYELPPLKLLDEPPAVTKGEDEKHLREVGNLLEKTFADFGLKVKVVGIHTGPVVTQYEIALETGLRVSRVTALADDLALNLKCPSVRIVAPLPGRNTVGLEVPNEHRAVVRLKELIQAAGPKIEKSKLPLLLGKDSEGRPLVYDLADMPHLLIAGRTGTGKSVCLNSIILSLLLTRTPEQCRLLMIDPKQVELAEYGQLPHLMHPVVTDNTKAEAILAWAVDKMEERYELMRKARVRNIAGFNELGRAEILSRVKPIDDADRDATPDHLAYIVIIVDEVGDLMMAMKKEVEGHIIRLAQKSRAAGIHIILTTQRPTVDVITGLIKSNLPARICFQVADRSNSRVVLDEMGAEKLLGKGDMLFLQPSTSTIIRAQGSYASDQEILRVVSHLEVETPEFDAELLNLQEKGSEGEGNNPPAGEAIKKRDALYEQAIEVVIREGRGSVSLLQRALGIGYGRAARLIDFMAEDGIVGSYNGAQAREVIVSQEKWDAMKSGDMVA
jgi:S-DNA-T family DNA segregation ATPase FtsK/SpoIIIE